MRRPDTDEAWTYSGLLCWIDEQSQRPRYIYHPWSEVRAIRKHLQNGGTIHNCPIDVDRWAMGEIIKDMADDDITSWRMADYPESEFDDHNWMPENE